MLVGASLVGFVAGCSAVGGDSGDSGALDCPPVSTGTSGSPTTLDETRSDWLNFSDLLLVEEARCGDGRTEFSVFGDYFGFTDCYSAAGTLLGSRGYGEGWSADCPESESDGLCDCNGDDYPVTEPDDGQCFSMLDCGDYCWTLDELRDWCEMFEDNLTIPDDYQREWTCADGRVEYYCPFDGNAAATYCFAPTGELLGMYDGRERTDTCEDYEGELCDCSGDGQPPGSE